MNDIPLARAVHLIPFIDVLREIGAPVERELARAKLPTLIEEIPDSYVSQPFTLDFVTRSVRLEGIVDLGFHAAKRTSLTNLSHQFLRVAADAPTLHARLACFGNLAWLDDHSIQVGLRRQGGDVRIICNLDKIGQYTGLQYAEWMQVKALIDIIRSGAGPDWQPDEITFRSHFTPCADTFTYFDRARILVGQPDTSITAPASLLAAPVRSLRLPAPEAGANGGRSVLKTAGRELEHRSFAATLQYAVKAYLREGGLPLDVASEIVGTSARSLQRKLGSADTTYSKVVEQARFEMAAQLLTSPEYKITEVAYDVGYGDAAHFSRAFRRLSGMSPREYRDSQIKAPGLIQGTDRHDMAPRMMATKQIKTAPSALAGSDRPGV